MTVGEAADYLRVHRSTIYRLIKEKQIPAFRVGSDYRILKKMLEKTLMGK